MAVWTVATLVFACAVCLCIYTYVLTELFVHGALQYCRCIEG